MALKTNQGYGIIEDIYQKKVCGDHKNSQLTQGYAWGFRKT